MSVAIVAARPARSIRPGASGNYSPLLGARQPVFMKTLIGVVGCRNAEKESVGCAPELGIGLVCLRRSDRLDVWVYGWLRKSNDRSAWTRLRTIRRVSVKWMTRKSATDEATIARRRASGALATKTSGTRARSARRME